MQLLCQILQTDMVLRFGAGGVNAVQALIAGDTDNLIGKYILPNRLNGEKYLRFLSELLNEAP
jgi:hypothetical protein